MVKIHFIPLTNDVNRLTKNNDKYIQNVRYYISTVKKKSNVFVKYTKYFDNYRDIKSL